MLKFLRAKKASFISWLIIGGIIVTFTLWGYFRKGSGPKSIAARVNDEIIPIETFQKEYRNDYRRYQSILKDKFTDELARLYNIRAITLERLIDTKLLVQTAMKNGIIVSDQDVATNIQNNPLFKGKDGKFDLDLYQRILRVNRFTPEKFENMVRERLYSEKITSLIRAGIRLSPEEIKKQYISENDRISLRYLELNPVWLEVSISPIEVSKMIKEEEKTISDYYKEHISEFKQPDRVKAKHILIKPASDSSDDTKKARKKIEEIAGKLTPENFKEMAKKYSEGPSAKTGGDLGIFNRKTMDPSFTKAAFSLKEGQISKPVKSNFGWHLIFLEKKYPAFERSLASAEKLIARELITKKKQKEMGSKKAREIVETLRYPSKLRKIIAELKLKWAKTPAFKFGSYIEGIGKAEEVIAAAFKLKKPGEFLPRFYMINNSYYFFRLAKREKPDLKKFDNEIAKMRQDLSTKKERILLNEWQNDIKKKAKIFKNPYILNYKEPLS